MLMQRASESKTTRLVERDTEMTPQSIQRQQLRVMVRGAYDLQKLRVMTGNRIVVNFKAKLGQKPGKLESEIDAEGQAILKDLRNRYKLLTAGVTTFPRQASFKGDEVISTYTELCLISQYIDLDDDETRHFARLKTVLRDHPIWNTFLEDVKGCGPAMAGVIISEIDIHKAEYPSSIWSYAGLDVARDGRGRSRRKEHLVERNYTDKDGNPAKRVGITFNPFLKTKLYVLATCFLKLPPDRCPYRGIYDDYKHRLEHSPAHQEKTKGHRHNMAMRYMIKRFLSDLYNHWRPLEGLSTAPEYSEGKLGIIHKAA